MLRFVVRDSEVDGRDGSANYTERSGYESELMTLLFYLESQQITNVLFLTGDTHWRFAISYDPDRDGKPNFYELATSPMSAITLPLSGVGFSPNHRGWRYAYPGLP